MTGTGAIVVRLGLYLDLMALFGIAAFALYALRGDERRFDGAIVLGPWLWGSVLLGAALSAVGLAMLAAGMAGIPLASVDLASVETILGATAVGTAWSVRMAALLVALLAVVALRRRPLLALVIVTAAAAVALASLAWGGHGAMDEGLTGWVHLAADIVHLLAAGIWVGALVSLLVLLLRPRGDSISGHLALSLRALAGFSLVGTVTVAAILVSGLVNAWLLVGPAAILALPASLYGRLLIAKLLLFAAMVALAATNRFRLVPAFERALAGADPAAALGALRRSLAIETGCAVAVLALVAWLGTLEPPMSVIGM